MERFFISRLDTEIGKIRVEGLWDPMTQKIQIMDLSHYQSEGWIDVIFWLSEQNHEADIAIIEVAVLSYLNELP